MIILVPNPPKLTINNQSSSNTLRGHIIQQSGGFDNFNISCNGTNQTFSIDDSSFIINNLIPGTFYKCQASTNFCNQTSGKSAPMQGCTGLYVI